MRSLRAAPRGEAMECGAIVDDVRRLNAGSRLRPRSQQATRRADRVLRACGSERDLAEIFDSVAPRRLAMLVSGLVLDASTAPVLGDALHELGCTNRHLLGALGARAAWPVALVAGEPDVVSRHYGPTKRAMVRHRRSGSRHRPRRATPSANCSTQSLRSSRVGNDPTVTWTVQPRGDLQTELARIEERGARAAGSPLNGEALSGPERPARCTVRLGEKHLAAPRRDLQRPSAVL